MKSNKKFPANSSPARAVKISRTIFLVSAIYGILILTPQLFRESAFSTNGVSLNHPEFFYGFFLLALAFQVLFIIVSTDPIKYRMAMVPGILEKGGHSISCVVLFLQHRLARDMFFTSLGDVVMLLLFIYSYIRTAPRKALYSRQGPSPDELGPLL